VAFTRGSPEVCELWKILEAQIMAYERTTNEIRHSANILDGDEKQSVFSNRRLIYTNLIHVTCQLLEEEFLTVIIFCICLY